VTWWVSLLPEEKPPWWGSASIR